MNVNYFIVERKQLHYRKLQQVILTKGSTVTQISNWVKLTKNILTTLLVSRDNLYSFMTQGCSPMLTILSKLIKQGELLAIIWQISKDDITLFACAKG